MGIDIVGVGVVGGCPPQPHVTTIAVRAAIRAVLAGGRGRISGIPSTTRAKTPLMVLIVSRQKSPA